MMTRTRLLWLCLALVATSRSDEITSESPITPNVTPMVSEAQPTVSSPPPEDPPALDSRARILLEPQSEQDPNILILGSQQTPNFPTVRPTLDDGVRAGANNDWTPIVWPATRVPVSAVAPSFTTSSTRLPVRIRPTQLVDRPVPSIVTAPARIVSALPTRTVPPTGSPPRIRIPPPLSVTRFDFGDVASPRPTSESVPDSVISPSAPVPSELPVAIATTETLTNQSTEATASPSVMESSSTSTSPPTTTQETLNVTSPTTPTDAPVIDTLLKNSAVSETSAFNESEPLLPPPIFEEIATDTPIESSSFAPSVDTNLLDSLPNDTDASIVEELEAQVTDEPAQAEEDSVTTDLAFELESANDTLIDVESSSFTPDFQVNQTLSSTTTEAASSTSEKAPIVSSFDVTSSTAPSSTNSLDETTPFSTTVPTEPKLNDNQPEEVTGRSTTTLSALGVLSTLFPALTRAPTIATVPPTTPAPITTTSFSSTASHTSTTSTATNPITTSSVSFPSTFWTSPTPPPSTTFVIPIHHSVVPFTPQMTTNPPTTVRFEDEPGAGHSTYDFSGSTTPHGDQHASTTIIAASVSVAVVICLALLLLAFLVLRRRKARAVQGTCQPARMDAFSLENVSETNTWQRGKLRNSLRASKRSYLNQAFDDSAVFSVPLTAAQLALYMEKPITSIEAEFRNVATSTVRIDELPPGVETKNRYANVLPVPETRVHIRMTDNRPEDILEQYINANYIRGPKEEAKYYIACQGPMEHTVEDFWQMVWENQCRLIIQLTDLTENGVARCAEYLPPSEVLDCHRLYGDYQVTLKSRELRDKYVTSSIQLKRMEDNLVREITHLWYSSWPVTGVPEDGKTIIELLLEARKGQSKEQQAPVVVHCSPGTGRTGAALAIDICMRQLDSSRSIDIPRSVHRLRQDRAGCVQTGEQYAFIYKAVSYYASQLSNSALDSL